VSAVAGKRVVFRADASLAIGTGHVMRCLTLADTLARRGTACVFVCRAHAGHLGDRIRARGHALHLLPAPTAPSPADPAGPVHAPWLGIDWETDAAQTAQALDDAVADWLVVDHYGIDARWEARLRPGARHLFVIDDLADRAHACDLLLDQTLGRDRADYDRWLPAAADRLVGPGYALLRPDFPQARAASLARRADGHVRQVLVSMGGIDRDDATSRVLAALEQAAVPGLQVAVVLGGQAPALAQVRRAAAAAPFPCTLHVDVDDMARLMAAADLAIGATGSTAWERCCVGLPSLGVVLAANQRAAAKALAGCGAALIIDGVDTAGQAQLAQACRALAADPARVRAMSARAAAVTDGEGTARVAARLAEDA
jgi:UDP-2,4-diacetamido-2,4,6-trideoxy-beta-L-altropyranose hydrolase